MSGWRPIETAPRNGTLILVREPKNAQVRLVVYDDHWRAWLSVPGRIRVRPTHWHVVEPFVKSDGRGAQKP